MSKKSELYAQFDSIFKALKESPVTIVMNNSGSTRGQIYQIHKATQEQSQKGLCGIILFSGNCSDTMKYLQGYRDVIFEILKVN
jgi:hypothetical protein